MEASCALAARTDCQCLGRITGQVPALWIGIHGPWAQGLLRQRDGVKIGVVVSRRNAIDPDWTTSPTARKYSPNDGLLRG